MGILEWATSPWGQRVPIHIAWFLIWVALIGRPGISDRACDLRSLFRKGERVRRRSAFRESPRVTSAYSTALAGGEIVSLDYGGGDVCFAVHGILAQSRSSVQLGDVSLDRRSQC